MTCFSNFVFVCSSSVFSESILSTLPCVPQNWTSGSKTRRWTAHLHHGNTKVISDFIQSEIPCSKPVCPVDIQKETMIDEMEHCFSSCCFLSKPTLKVFTANKPANSSCCQRSERTTDRKSPNTQWAEGVQQAWSSKIHIVSKEVKERWCWKFTCWMLGLVRHHSKSPGTVD